MEIRDTLTARTWPANTRVRVCHVPWDANYSDVVLFADGEAEDEYFDSLQSWKWTSDKFTYLRPNEPITIPVPYAVAYTANYVIVDEGDQPIDTYKRRRLQYFITNIEYVAPGTTLLTLQLDVMLTRGVTARIGSMYVEAGHIGVSNEAIWDHAQIQGTTLKKYLDVPEGLDIGSDMQIANREWVPLLDEDQTMGRIVIVSAADLTSDPGTVNAPSMKCAGGQMADGLPSGCNVYTCDPALFRSVMGQLQDKSWVAQSIISISTFPAALLPEGEPVKLFGDAITINELGNTPSATTPIDTIYQSKPISEMLKSTLAQVDPFGYFRKLYAYPYSVIEMSAFSGNSVMLKPQLLATDAVILAAVGCALPPFARAAVYPLYYNNTEGHTHDPSTTWKYFAFGGGKQQTGAIPEGDFLDTCLWLSDFPQFSIVNNAYISYMASTTHTREYNYQAAGWSNTKANAGADLAYSQAQASMSTAQQNQDINNMATFANAGIDTASSLLSGGVGGIGGVVGGLAHGAVNYLSSNAQFGNNQKNAQYVADSNKKFANMANAGDYQQAIKGIQATVQDAALTPPSQSGQMGGQGFLWKNGLVGVALTYKMASGAQLRSVVDYWRRYGYQVHRFIQLNDRPMRDMLVMSDFSYWKASEVYISAVEGNEDEVATIRGVFQRGVTFWRDPNAIGRVDISRNRPLKNIRY